MYQTFEEDLFYDEAEGPALPRYTRQAYDEFEDGFEDEFDLMEDYAGDYGEFDEGDAFDLMEEAMADALAAEDTDEFLRRLRRAARSVGRVARTVGRGVGQVARTVAPIARLIPHPAAQAVGRVASIAGRLLADGADELEALDELVDMADDEYFIDAAAPTMAGLAIHGTMPQTAASLPQPVRQQLVQATTQTARTLARQQGPQAVRALPGVVQTAQRVARRQGASARQLPQITRKVGARIARNPALLRRLLRANPALRQTVCAACAGTGARRPGTGVRRPMMR
jgi:hypothetical protein